jgi:uncharacterized damage-inducible protein DinB
MGEPWTASAPARIEPDRVADERASLEQWLDYHRATLLNKCAGLDEQQLKARPLTTSGLSLLGLVRHMTEVERWWFRMHAAQQDLQFPYDPDGIGLDFDDTETADAAANLDAYVAECDASREAVVSLPLDDIVPGRDHHAGRVRNIRWIYVHMIEEYARHNGHADLLREAIDGETGE